MQEPSEPSNVKKVIQIMAPSSFFNKHKTYTYSELFTLKKTIELKEQVVLSKCEKENKFFLHCRDRVSNKCSFEVIFMNTDPSSATEPVYQETHRSGRHQACCRISSQENLFRMRRDQIYQMLPKIQQFLVLIKDNNEEEFHSLSPSLLLPRFSKFASKDAGFLIQGFESVLLQRKVKKIFDNVVLKAKTQIQPKAIHLKKRPGRKPKNKRIKKRHPIKKKPKNQSQEQREEQGLSSAQQNLFQCQEEEQALKIFNSNSKMDSSLIDFTAQKVEIKIEAETPIKRPNFFQVSSCKRSQQFRDRQKPQSTEKLYLDCDIEDDENESEMN